jgi:tRNA-uridine 2-sulfurtransferase
MNRKAVTLLSGGLDSLLAAKAVLEQGIEVVGLHFTSPLCNNIEGDRAESARRAAAELGIPMVLQDKGEAYLQLVKKPKHGYGKNMNPCIDCRIYMLKLTYEVMMREEASFIVTGEVLGQRPMSQRRDTMALIEKESELHGLIVRPLSAKLFPPTLPETEGILDREKLFAISGRSRQAQFALAEQYGLKEYACPAGGCLLTDPIFSQKLKELFTREENCSMTDISLLRLGRHFRVGEGKLILGRNKEENEYLESSWTPPYRLVYPDFKGPWGVVKGDMDDRTRGIVGNLIALYAKSKVSPIVFEAFDGKATRFSVEKSEIDPESYRI